MQAPLRPLLLAALSLALAACSSGPRLGGGKEGAAQALFQATQVSPFTSAAGARVRAAGMEASLAATSADCPKGGKVTLKLDMEHLDPTAQELAYGLDYDGCSVDGHNAYDGELTTRFSSTVDETGGGFDVGLKGKLDISGDVDDFVDADIRQSVELDLSGAGSAVVRLTGTIRTATATYTYDGSPLTVTLGALPTEEPQG
jgi:hypothetical protein